MPDPDPGSSTVAQRAPVDARGRPIAAALFVLFVLTVAAPLVAVAIASTFLFPPGGRVLEVEMRATAGTYAQIFWSSDFAMSPNDSSLAPLHPQSGAFETLRFTLPAKPLEVVRFDPIDGPGEVVIRQLRIVDDRGRIVRTIDPQVMSPLYQIAVMRPAQDGFHVITTPGANDPMLVARSSWFSAPPRWNSLQFVTALSLTWIAVAVAALIAAGVAFVVRDLRAGRFTRADGLWLAAVTLVIVAAKLLLVQRYPVPVPFWDQWDGEALTLYIPWADHGLTWRQMFTFHNEHRIFFSRLLAVVLVVANGQWDPHLQIVVNALLHTLVGAIVASVLWLAMERRYLPAIAVCVALVFAAPFGVENSLAGFQSAFYFMLLFSTLAIWLMGTARAGSAAWWLGVFYALCTPFTVAGGILIVAPLACLVLLQAIALRSGWWRLLANAAALAVVAGIAYAALPPPIEAHAPLKAQSVFYFVVALARSLAFPFINYPRAALLMWLPATCLAGAVLWRRLNTTAIERLALALAVWGVVQSVAVAYSRGATGAAPVSRYMDTLAFGVLANAMALLSFIGPLNSKRWNAGWAAALAIWIGVVGVGIGRVSDEMLETIARERRQWTPEHVKNVRLFVMNGDLDSFLEKKGPRDLPHYSASMLATWLEDPYLRGILPAAIRQPLDVRPREDGPGRGSATPQADGDVQPVFDSYGSARAKGIAHFESQPVSCGQFHHLRFEIASSASWSGLSLALHDLRSGANTPVQMPWNAQGGWNAVSVRCPAGQFTVVADDSSPSAWLAFRQPSEMAWASTIALLVIQQAMLFALAALTVVALAVASSMSARQVEQAT
jgi:hypothetical protein